MFGSGSTTTASAITVVIMVAACFPHMQTWVQEELDAVVGPPTFDGYVDLPRVLLESYRWRPVGGNGFAHRASRDIIWPCSFRISEDEKAPIDQRGFGEEGTSITPDTFQVRTGQAGIRIASTTHHCGLKSSLDFSAARWSLWSQPRISPSFRKTLPRPLYELASKAELIVWLTRAFVYTILPGYSSHIPSARVINTGNLVMFVDSLVHLHRVGFPPHWLEDFLGALLFNSLVTDVALYSGEWPVPLEEQDKRVPKRKVDIYPWLIDLESIFADAYEVILSTLFDPQTFPAGLAI
ncbi:uncharacterized protein EV420DRAFT_1768754 [Desarmillaria tabescens]|uniref:Cytochrome P450 n=1 Tax=Armillaria tabescens TaxID=1929756 RepID=A0AA39JIA1_ARMTA|nr:uncharacterized protein EV420DRAFT_1768754 [Desarmillaria tabescens]KAK0442677.1 hypothetical protein EV420DRAFT_1768754 [Desarmillaria tabescens]